MTRCRRILTLTGRRILALTWWRWILSLRWRIEWSHVRRIRHESRRRRIVMRIGIRILRITRRWSLRRRFL